MTSRFLLQNRAARSSFTLIELLIVIAIVAILSVVAILVLNPAELLKQSRDSNRLSEMNTLNQALHIFQVEAAGASMGSATTVYTSLPDSSATCANLGLPALPAGYTYGCVASENLRNIDGTGWIPVNFTLASTNSPISSLPVDPVNSTTTGQYYTYIPGGSWELTAMMESRKHRLGGGSGTVENDGGDSYGVYETGNNLGLNPVSDSGLISYWTLNEGVGTSVFDSGTSPKHGTWTGTTPYYVTGRVGPYAGRFNGSDLYVETTPFGNLPTGSAVRSISFWFKANAGMGETNIAVSYGSTGGGRYVGAWANQDSIGVHGIGCGFNGPATPAPIDGWHFYTAVYGGSDEIAFYIDGNFGNTDTGCTLDTGTAQGVIIGNAPVGWGFYNGNLDDVRIYNVALSAAQVRAIYNATR